MNAAPLDCRDTIPLLRQCAIRRIDWLARNREFCELPHFRRPRPLPPPRRTSAPGLVVVRPLLREDREPLPRSPRSPSHRSAPAGDPETTNAVMPVYPRHLPETIRNSLPTRKRDSATDSADHPHAASAGRRPVGDVPHHSPAPPANSPRQTPNGTNRHPVRSPAPLPRRPWLSPATNARVPPLSPRRSRQPADARVPHSRPHSCCTKPADVLREGRNWPPSGRTNHPRRS